MKPRLIAPRRLNAADFAPFGDVIATENAPKSFAINEGHTTRYHDLAALDLIKGGGEPCLSIFRSTPKALPLELNVMERHPLSSQAFFPLGDVPYLVAVAPKGEFDERAVAVFLAGPGEGVNYHAGIWHHYSLALDEVSDFLVIDCKGCGDNLDEVCLEVPIQIDLSEVTL